MALSSYPMNYNRIMHVRTKTVRLNYDHTISPTVFNHFGIGYRRYNYPDRVESINGYDSRISSDQTIPSMIQTLTPGLKSAGKVPGLGLTGAQTLGFPVISGLMTGTLGATNNSYYFQDKPTITESLGWVRGSHLLKFGAEWKHDTYTNRSYSAALSAYGFSPDQTGLPATEGQNLSGGSIGNALASLMMGSTSNYSVRNVSDPQWRRTSYAGFGQDTWRVNSKLTIDAGLRWDWISGWGEMDYRQTGWSPDVSIPAANNLKGGLVFAGYGTGRINGKFGKSYPWAFAPRLGVAYKFQEKTVVRAGAGITYGAAPPNQYTTSAQSLGNGWNTVDGEQRSLRSTGPRTGQIVARLIF